MVFIASIFADRLDGPRPSASRVLGRTNGLQYDTNKTRTNAKREQESSSIGEKKARKEG